MNKEMHHSINFSGKLPTWGKRLFSLWGWSPPNPTSLNQAWFMQK